MGTNIEFSEDNMTATELSVEDVQFSDLSEFRRSLYLFFSALFSREATPELLADAGQILNLLSDFDEIADPSTNADLCSGITALQECLQLNPISNTLLLDLARQYALLFLGIGEKNTIPLCESAYQGDGKSLYQNCYFEIRNLFAGAGIGKDESFTEPEDHLSLELAFMAELCTMTIDLEERQERPTALLDAQQQMLDEHLSKWVPLLSDKLTETAPSSLYAAGGLLLKGYLQADAALLAIHREQCPTQ